jgi:signal transduction histidine kinase
VTRVAKTPRISRTHGSAAATADDTREQLAAVSEILKAMAGPADLDRVSTMIVSAAARLVGALAVRLTRRVGTGWILAAAHGPRGPDAQVGAAVVLDSTTLRGQTLLAGFPYHIRDTMTEDPRPRSPEVTRSRLSIPVVADGQTIAVLTVSRKEPGGFSEHEQQLVATFADQAAIAIENVRLFNETKEALERQTALAEILRVISRSPTDVQPVLDAIVENALRFCAAEDAAVMLPSGDHLGLAAHRGSVPVASDLRYPNDGTSLSSRAFLEARTIAVQDLQTAISFPLGAENARSGGYHATVGAPLLHAGAAVGVIVLRRFDARPFTEREIGALETFADQAVIAIENVRLFNETKDALERQTATSELLTVISQSTFDLQPVLEIAMDKAVALCRADHAWLRLDDLAGRNVVYRGPSTTALASLRVSARKKLSFRPNSIMDALYRERATIHVADAPSEPRFADSGIVNLVHGRTTLGVPLLRGDEMLGAMVLVREAVRPFSEREIDLVKTFADQAVIAISNVQLFREIQQKSAELAAASRHKSEFLANMSHELRTPLNAIIGFSDVLEQRLFGALNERQADYTHDIASSGRHLLDLVNEILDLSKVEAGKMELEPSEFDLADTIRGAVGFVRERAAAHRIALMTDLPTDLPTDLGTIVADERKVRQVLLNLLSNAVKFTPDGGTITIRARTTAGEVQVSVQDTGIGIAPEDQAKVFDEFQQVGTATDRSREGTGLGLTLAKRFIELHGGRIWVESEIGKGTTFTFAIPVGARPLGTGSAT